MLLEKMKAVDIRTVKQEDVVDIRKIEIDKNLSQQEMREEFIKQVKNPYCFRVGNIIIKAGYSQDGVSLEERFGELLMSL